MADFPKQWILYYIEVVLGDMLRGGLFTSSIIYYCSHYVQFLTAHNSGYPIKNNINITHTTNDGNLLYSVTESLFDKN